MHSRLQEAYVSTTEGGVKAAFGLAKYGVDRLFLSRSSFFLKIDFECFQWGSKKNGV